MAAEFAVPFLRKDITHPYAGLTSLCEDLVALSKLKSCNNGFCCIVCLSRFPDTAAREFNTKKLRRPPLAEASLLGIETNHMTREVPSYYHRKDH